MCNFNSTEIIQSCSNFGALDLSYTLSSLSYQILIFSENPAPSGFRNRTEGGDIDTAPRSNHYAASPVFNHFNAVIFVYKPWRPNVFFLIWNHHTYFFLLHLNTYVMGLRPLHFLIFQVRRSILEVRFWRLKSVSALNGFKQSSDETTNNNWHFFCDKNIGEDLATNFSPTNSSLIE